MSKTTLAEPVAGFLLSRKRNLNDAMAPWPLNVTPARRSEPRSGPCVTAWAFPLPGRGRPAARAVHAPRARPPV